MTKDYSFNMWKKIFSSLGNPCDQRVIHNPAVKFRADVKAGRYDSMPDDEFDRLAEDVKAESAVFEDRLCASAAVLFLRSFSLITLEKRELDRIAGILSTAMERGTEEEDELPYY